MSTKTIVVRRRGRYIEIDSIWADRVKSRNKEVNSKRRKTYALRVALECFDGNVEQTRQYLSETVLPQYKLTIAELLNRGKFKAVMNHLKSLQKHVNSL